MEEKRTRDIVVAEYQEAQRQHTKYWNLRSIETDAMKRERQRLNRLRKKLKAEIETYQLSLF